MISIRIPAFPVLLAAMVFFSLPGCSENNESQTADAPDTETQARADQQAVGRVDFRVSCGDEVREDFNRALALLHHMMYQQARAAFEKIAEADPQCAMAHWGMATTLFQPLWPERPDRETLDRGWQRISAALDEGTSDPREQRLMEATAGFFREPGSANYRTRIERWGEALATAYQDHPDDADIIAFYGLSRLALAGGADNPDELRDEAETVLRRVWENNAAHPGAIHYTIHATDADGRADNALDIVQAYSDIAPQVPHALHMPSHIYVRLGDWPTVIEWNRRSAEAALKHPVNGDTSLHYIHALDYLLYAHLQQGADERADAVLEKAMGRDRYQPTFITAFHSAAMPARIAVERRDWQAATRLTPKSPEYLPWDKALWPRGLTWFARGLGAVHTGDGEAARQALEKLESLRDQARDQGETGFATYLDMDRHILAGWIAHSEGDHDKAVELIRSAGELEDGTQKSPVTPGALLPPREALGDLLMELDRPAEALAAYQQSNDTWPGRFNTLAGAARAAKASDDQDKAGEYYNRLLEMAGDSDRATVGEARKFTGS